MTQALTSVFLLLNLGRYSLDSQTYSRPHSPKSPSTGMSQSLTNVSQNETHAHLVNSALSPPWNGVQEPLGVWRGPGFLLVDVESCPK